MAGREINRAIQSVLLDIGRRRTQGLREFRARLDKLRQLIVLAVVQDEQLDAFTVQGIRSAVYQLTGTYSAEFQALMSEEGRKHFLRGIQLIDRVLKGSGLTVALPHLSEAVLEEVVEFRAELVTNLTNEIRAKVVQELQLAALGQKPQAEVVQAIGRSLRSGSIFGSTWARAQVIYSTEMARMQNLGATRRITQATQQVRGLKKRWLHSHLGTPRLNHLAMDGETVSATGKFRLPDGRKAGIVYKVDGPQDARLPAGEVVGCRCVVIPVVPGLEKQYPKTLIRK